MGLFMRACFLTGGMKVKIGYIRVSTQEQNTIRQEVLMRELGADEVYIVRMSGKNANRPELQRMIEYVRRGDTDIENEQDHVLSKSK